MAKSKPDPTGEVAETAMPTPATPRELFPRHIVPLQPPAPYAPLELQVWCNPPTGTASRWAEGATVDQFLAHVVLSWTLTDADGQPVPVTVDTLNAMPDDLRALIVAHYNQHRLRPLGGPATTPTSA